MDFDNVKSVAIPEGNAVQIYDGSYVIYEPNPITGTSPLNFCAEGRPLVKCSVSGKIVQNGTPSVQTKTLEFGTLVQDSYVSNTDGTIIPYSSWDRTDYIAIPVDMKHITVEVGSTYNNKYNCWYDENKQFISSFTIWNASSGTKILTADVPANAKYVIFSGPRNWMESASVTYNAIQPIPVQGVGERTANLFDESTIEVGGLSPDTGEETAITTRRRSGFVSVEPRTNYGLSREITSSGSFFWVIAYDESKNIVTDATVSTQYSGVLVQGTTLKINRWTFVTTPTTRYIRWYVTVDNSYKNIMLNTGSTALPYEPYGYKVTITNRGKNLFDATTLESGIYLAASGNKYGGITDGVRAGAKIKALPNTTYTLSVHSSENVSLRILEWSNGTFTNQTPRYHVSGSISLTVTTGLETTEIAFNIEGINGQYVTNIMLNIGSTATAYEPYRDPITTTFYTDKPLYGNGTNDDYLQRLADGSGVEHRAWGVYVFDGSEKWDKGNYPPTGGYQFFAPKPSDISDTPDWLTTHFKKGTGLNGSAFGSYISLYPESSILPENATANDFKNWLAAQYAAGTPVIVVYTLATPTDTPVTLPEIPTAAGRNTLTVNTTVPPSQVSVKVLGGEYPELENVFITADGVIFITADGTPFGFEEV